jgi:Zn-dependent protease with chaperone function
MSVAPNAIVCAAKGKSPAKIKNQQWPALFKSLWLPVVVLILFAAAPHWLNNKVRDEVIKGIDNSTKLSAAEKGDRVAAFSRIDFGAVCRDNPPEYAQLHDALVKAGVAATFQHLRWGLDGSVVLAGLLLATSGFMLTLSRQARKSRDAMVRCYQLGWRVGMVSAFVQVLLLVPLLTYGVYEFPVLWTNSWSPKLVILILLAGIFALIACAGILLRKVPLQFDEPMSRRVTPDQAPDLWQAVRAAAARLETTPPDNIIIGLQMNFYVTELAVVGGGEQATGRTLFLSYPMLKQLPEEEVLAVIGHELGHFIGDDTRLTREFYPMKFKAHATLITLARATYVGWTSFQFLNFFNWCFVETEQEMSRKRELLADAKAASLTSPQTTARALVRFHVLLEAFRQGLVDTVRKGAQSPLDIPLHTVVREKLHSGVAFWTELFDKKLPHPLDSHPALNVRLESLGQAMDAREAEALATQETESAYAKWFANRDELFVDIRRQADEAVVKMRSKAQVHDADYETAEGRELLERHFPEKRWKVRQSSFWFVIVLLGCLTAGCFLAAVLLLGVGIWFVIISALLGGWCAFGCALQWRRHRHAEFTVNADGINYTGWVTPLRFQQVGHVSGRKVYGTITMTFRLKEPKPPIWNGSLLRYPRKTVSFSLSGLADVKQVTVAQTIFRYYSRQMEK